MDEELKNPLQAQVVAIATLVGCLIGLLRERQLIAAEEAEAILTMTDSLIPEDASGMALRLLANVRNVAAAIKSD